MQRAEENQTPTASAKGAAAVFASASSMCLSVLHRILLLFRLSSRYDACVEDGRLELRLHMLAERDFEFRCIRCKCKVKQVK